MPSKSGVYLGLMSGTSIDSIAASLVRFERGCQPEILHFVDMEWPKLLQQQVRDAQTSWRTYSMVNFVRLEQQITMAFVQACKLLPLSDYDVEAIGFHGQTLAHGADEDPAWTIQAGNPALLAAETNLPVVAHFRQSDLAAKGQGAPLAPAFHIEIFGSEISQAIVNLGGIANVTFIVAGEVVSVSGFDTGPANCLMDAWIRQHKGLEYDESGQWSLTGQCHQQLLNTLLGDPYFKQVSPKSTGTEYFNLHWLQSYLDQFQGGDLIEPEDIMATLRELTAVSIASSLKLGKNTKRIILCGGGSYNQALVQSVQNKCEQECISSRAVGYPPEQIEAALMAWMAMKRDDKQPIDLQQITGSIHPVVCGGIYLPGSHMANS